MSRTNTKDLAGIAEGFHALSDPIRVEVIDLLRGGERCVCELMDSIKAAQSRLSFHLKVLKEAGLVTDRREGRWVYYALDQTVIGELEEFLTDRRRTRSPLSRAVACCD